MAITLIGLHSAEKRNGDTPTGVKTFILESDTQITDDIDLILDFSDVPAYDETWDATNAGLKVRQKGATAMDEQEGFMWMVTANYEVSDTNSDQDADPRDRAWDWSKGPDKRQIVAPSSLFATTGHVYPDTAGGVNKNLAKGDAIQNTAGLPFSDGVVRTISRQIITLTKYVDDYSDLGQASWTVLDAFVDSVNSDTISILGVSYPKWQLLMDDISYSPHSENGFDVIKVSLRIIADPTYTHVGSFPSQGYKQIKATKLVPIVDDKGNEVAEPRLLDIDGLAIPVTGALIDPIYVNAGLNIATAWTSLTLPATIP